MRSISKCQPFPSLIHWLTHSLTLRSGCQVMTPANLPPQSPKIKDYKLELSIHQGQIQDFESEGALRIFSCAKRANFFSRAVYQSLTPHPKFANRWGARGWDVALTFHCYFLSIDIQHWLSSNAFTSLLMSFVAMFWLIDILIYIGLFYLVCITY